MTPSAHRWGLIAIGLLFLLAGPGMQAQDAPEEPTLPPGLGEPDEPGLPPGLGDQAAAADEEAEKKWSDRLPGGLNGFIEARVGPRTGSDPAHSKDFTLAELRLQLAYERAFEHVTLVAKGDGVFDGVLDETPIDLRNLQLNFRPARSLDVQVGRQVMTWGTGDLLFINDLFPKDWSSFFIGRDEEYLKAPADAVRIGWFPGKLSVDVAYVPEFEPDRFIRGERISFWDSGSGGFRGDATPVSAAYPGGAEWALRVYGNTGSYELSAYGYSGFWKSPAGFDPVGMQATFPELDVWGASARGPLGPGIGNVEIGLLDSIDDPDGVDPLTSNSEARLLAGYEQELASELTGGFQFYLERLLDYGAYLANLPGGTARDETRAVLTTRLTKLLRGQTLIPSIFVYYSPTDQDGYLRPKLTWKRSDRMIVEVGGNFFFGRRDDTFFGQFENNSNVYASIRLQP